MLVFFGHCFNISIDNFFDKFCLKKMTPSQKKFSPPISPPPQILAFRQLPYLLKRYLLNLFGQHGYTNKTPHFKVQISISPFWEWLILRT